MKNVRDALMVGHTSDGKTVRRPLSPHLQVYTPQMTSILSIMNRVTGIAVSAGTLLLVWWLVAAAAGPSAYDTVQSFIASPVGLFVLFGWTASLMFHFFNGMRHLAWDAGYGFGLPEAYASGWAVVIATGVSSVLIWIAGLLLMGR
ncbi:MAG: succinate dehydrogenase, cytochrome b556 subunit [Gemmatimonadaceae bacterium]|nr:succinate dehydrogenase, cytochrome b556 subunit [Acetobacteraceae bacterium]